jgi:hypothetical protein
MLKGEGREGGGSERLIINLEAVAVVDDNNWNCWYSVTQKMFWKNGIFKSL